MRSTLAALLLLATALSAACTPIYEQEDRRDLRPRVMRIQEHYGGSHHRTIVAAGKWYQAFSNELLVIDPQTGRTQGNVEVVPFGEGGPVVDLAVDDLTVWAVSDYTCVVPIDVSTPARPTAGVAITARELGIEPRRVSLAGGDVWVTGEGGAVRLRDRKRFLTGEAPGRVVQTSAGPATTVKRRIVMVEDGRYLGAATELQPLPHGFGPDGGYLFVLQGATSAQVGLMTPAFTETASVAVPGFLRRARVVGDKLFLVTEVALEAWTLADGKLTTPNYIRVKGARDLDIIKPNHYAVAGTFGRAMYRMEREGSDPADTFYNAKQEPGLLEQAVPERTRVLAGGREGFWLWRHGREPETTLRTTDITALAQPSVDAAWGSAKLVKDPSVTGAEVFRSVEIQHDGTKTIYKPDGNPRISTLSLVAGDLWIGHDRGLDVLRRQLPGVDATTSPAPSSVEGMQFKPIHEFRFEGPVLFIFPDGMDAGASVVSLHGGFILMRPVPVGAAPVFQNRGNIR